MLGIRVSRGLGATSHGSGVGGSGFVKHRRRQSFGGHPERRSIAWTSSEPQN
jgi:hypothetical protein